MIVIAIFRVSGLRIRKNKIDVQWEIFWQEVEATAAVIMVSITAFRSRLGIKALKARKKRDRSWFSYRQKLLTRHFKKTPQDKSVVEQLPSIPAGTFTGMWTVIRGDRNWEDSSAMGISHESKEAGLGADGNLESQEIKVTHQLSSESEILPGLRPSIAANIV